MLRSLRQQMQRPKHTQTQSRLQKRQDPCNHLVHEAKFILTMQQRGLYDTLPR